jgi:outer membrane protein TolC
VHEAKATEGDREAQTLALIAAFAQGWYDVAASREQVALIESQVKAQTALLELVRLRYERGGASGLDVLQQRQQVANTQAALPTAKALYEAQRMGLAALLGRSLDALDDGNARLPEPAPLPAVGTPAELVEQRPSLVASGQRTLSARDQRASAQLGLLPTFRLSANAGWTGFFDEGLQQEPTWGAGATLSVPLFNGGATHGRIRQARASENLAVYSHNQSIRDTIAAVDGAILSDEAQRARYAAVVVQEAAAREAFTESRVRYLEGLDSYVTVLASQSAHQVAELSLLQARRDATRARIQLHDALGGVPPDALEMPR